MLQELVPAQVPSSCTETPRRLWLHIWSPVLQPFVPTKHATHLERFRSSPMLPKQPSAPQRIFPVNELAAQHPQRAALPWAPHHSQLVGTRLNLALKPSRQHLTEEEQS